MGATNTVPSNQIKTKQIIGLLAGIAAMLIIMLLPIDGYRLPGVEEMAALSIKGKFMLAIVAFAVIVWLTEAVSYEVSSLAILALIAICVGLAPDTIPAPTETDPEAMQVVRMGTKNALRMALGGFSTDAWALVAGATFLAAAMTFTGLDRRIALVILNTIGTSTKRILIGVIAVTIVLSLFVPSATARVACIVPIMTGIIAAYGVDNRSRIAVGIMIMVAEATSVWNVGIQTAAAQNLNSLGFMQEYLIGPMQRAGIDIQGISWIDWLIAGGPWSVIMSVVLFFVVLKIMPPEADNIPGGKEAVQKELRDLGPMPGPQLRLLIITCTMLAFWATGGKLHAINTAAATTAGLVVLMLPGIGVINWKEVQKRAPWGTILVFGVGIGLGIAMGKETGAGKWLGALVVHGIGLTDMTPFMIFAILAAFLIVIHLGFASATALCSLFMPIMISMFGVISQSNEALTPQIQLGLSMLLGFVVSFGFILPINAPQNMVCLGTNTFTAGELAKVGIPITVIGYLLMLLMAATYWPMLGWL